MGVPVDNNTKDAKIQRLEDRIREIEQGDFSSLPALDAISIDSSEINGIATNIADDCKVFFDLLLAPLPGAIRNNDKVKELRDSVVNKVKDKTNAVLQSQLNFANTEG